MLLRLRSNEPASPPCNWRKKQFILTNSESLQQGWLLLSNPVYHTEAYVLEQRGEGTGSQMIYASLTQGENSNSGEPGCKRYLPTYPASWRVASTECAGHCTWIHTRTALPVPLSGGVTSPPFTSEVVKPSGTSASEMRHSSEGHSATRWPWIVHSAGGQEIKAFNL